MGDPQIATHLGGYGLMEEYPQKLLVAMTQQGILDPDTVNKVWNLYKSTGLLYQKHDQWQMWGDKNTATGKSRGPIPHSIVVTAATWVLANALQVSAKDKTNLVEAAMVHDGHKRWEVEEDDPDSVIATQMLNEQFGTTVRMFAQLSGHTSMPQVLTNMLGTAPLKTFIVFWVDNAVVGTKLQPAAAKCDYLDQAAKNGRYPYNAEGIGIYGVPFFTFQRHLSLTIEACLAQALGITPTDNLAMYVEKMIKEQLLS